MVFASRSTPLRLSKEDSRLMANRKHLEIIKQGIRFWNSWRVDNPEITTALSGAQLSRLDLRRADLRSADLSGADLRHADLSGADFRGADLSGADLLGADLLGAQLSGADLRITRLPGVNLSDTVLTKAQLSGAVLRRAQLSGAVLHGAVLHGTDLRGADLRGADLRGADFNEADLSWADLSRADLSGANLRGADLSKAIVALTVFADLDLSTVKGLGTVKHNGPSRVSMDTLSGSKGHISEAFLRGCGLSNWEIEISKLYRPEITNQELGDILYMLHDLRANQAIQISPVFISYSHLDSSFVDHLERQFVNDGIRFWRDMHHATSGRLESQVDRAIRLNPTVLLILSENSTQSDWVEHEAWSARETEKELGRDVLCPIALDTSWKDCRWPERLRRQIMEYNILDFSKWRDNASFERMYWKLVEGLDAFYNPRGAGLAGKVLER
jgi:uncharacterized protein YjbI with pentapeptide repeats